MGDCDWQPLLTAKTLLLSEYLHRLTEADSAPVGSSLDLAVEAAAGLSHFLSRKLDRSTEMAEAFDQFSKTEIMVRAAADLAHLTGAPFRWAGTLRDMAKLLAEARDALDGANAASGATIELLMRMDVEAAMRAPPPLPSATPARSTHTAPAAAEGVPYSPRNVREVFSTLACQAATIRDSLSTIEGLLCDDDFPLVDVQCRVHLIRMGVELSGAICDQMLGGNIIGTVASWATHDGISPLEGGAQ